MSVSWQQSDRQKVGWGTSERQGTLKVYNQDIIFLLEDVMQKTMKNSNIPVS